MTRTKIEYGERNWNPVTGCSAGCPWGCWAAAVAGRFPLLHHEDGESKFSGAPPVDFKAPIIHRERLRQPLGDRIPRRILVSFMGDLFGPEIPAGFIGEVCAIMAAAHWHTFFLLTKRAENLGVLSSGILPDNAFIGVSITNQAEADERIPLLLNVPAKNRWLSIEPMLGPIDLAYSCFNGADSLGSLEGIHWVVVGSIDYPTKTFPAPKRGWIEAIRTQCRHAGVPLWEKKNLALRWGRPPGRVAVIEDRELLKQRADL